MKDTIESQPITFGLLGAVIGGFIGYFAFFWIARQGFYALFLPPGFLGLGAGILNRRRSILLAFLCGVMGLALGLFTEWSFAPFIIDKSLAYFIAHVQALKPLTLLMLAFGAFLSYRLALGFKRKPDRFV